MNTLALQGFLAASFCAGWIGAQFKPGDWYQSLVKPGWTPPGIAFPIAWTVLYALMSVAAWLVWKKRGQDASAFNALLVFAVQLVLNAAWSWIFFGRHQMGFALLEMSALWGTILVTLLLFWRVSATAGILLVPYLLWVSFALALNAAIWKRN